MNFKKIILLTGVILLLFGVSIAQKRIIKKGNAAFESGEYFKAYELYEKAFEKIKGKPAKADISFKLGECSRYLNKPRKAKKWFRKSISNKTKQPLALLYYADALKMLESYEKAKNQYQAYLDLVPDDERGQNGLESCKLVEKWMADPTRHEIKRPAAIVASLSRNLFFRRIL